MSVIEVSVNISTALATRVADYNAEMSTNAKLSSLHVSVSRQLFESLNTAVSVVKSPEDTIRSDVRSRTRHRHQSIFDMDLVMFVLKCLFP